MKDTKNDDAEKNTKTFRYMDILKQTGDPESPEARAFREANADDKEFTRRAPVLNRVFLTEQLESKAPMSDVQSNANEPLKTTEYVKILQQTGDTESPEARAFREANANDRRFTERAKVLDRVFLINELEPKARSGEEEQGRGRGL